MRKLSQHVSRHFATAAIYYVQLVIIAQTDARFDLRYSRAVPS